MGLLDWFRPKWRHRDPGVRRAAVERLAEHQEPIALRVARDDADAAVRAVAATRVTSERGLRSLLTAADPAVQRAARERLAGKAVEIARDGALADVKPLLDGIAERSSLAELVRGARDVAVRDAAFAKLLADAEASQSALETLAIQDADGRFAPRAVAALTRRGALKDVARKAKREDVRAAAQQRLDALVADAEKPSDEQRRRERAQRLRRLVDRAATLASASDPARAVADLPAIEAEWQRVVADYAGLADDAAVAEALTRFTRARASIADREAQRAARLAEERERSARRDDFLARLPTRLACLDAGERADVVAEWRALGDATSEQQGAFARLMATLDAPAGADAAPAPAPVEPDEATRTALEALSAECEQLAASDDFRAAAEQWPALHKRWMQLTAAIGERHPLARRFTDAYARFKQRRRDARDARDARDRERVATLGVLAMKAEQLAKSPVADDQQRARYDELVALQAEWKSVGPVKPALVEGVRARFRAAMDEAFKPVKALQEAEDWQRFANAAKAEELIARVEALAAVEDVARIAREVRQAHKDWKTLGAQPRGKSRDLWTRFKTACDAQYDRCKVVFAAQDADRQANLEQKRALIAELEQLASRGTVGLAGSVADRQAKAQALTRVKEIQARWKEIGPVPRAEDQAIWTRFKQLCDPFFAEGNRLREQEQQANLDAKRALCDEAERMAGSAEGVSGAIGADKQRWLKQVRELQSRWKLIGHVPMAEKEPVWQRFKAACDRVYALTKEEVAAQEQERAENLAKKQALIAELEGLFGQAADPHSLRDDVKRLQDRWRDIGHVPREHYEPMRARWQELCDRAFR